MIARSSSPTGKYKVDENGSKMQREMGVREGVAVAGFDSQPRRQQSVFDCSREGELRQSLIKT